MEKRYQTKFSAKGVNKKIAKNAKKYPSPAPIDFYPP